MTAIYETTIVLALFLLRLGIPLAVIVLISGWLKRLDTRWAAEASAYGRAKAWDAQATAQQMVQALTPPCWVQRACPADQRAHCAANQQPTLPCWLARMRQEGHLPTACVNCAIFALPLTIAPANALSHTGGGDD